MKADKWRRGWWLCRFTKQVGEEEAMKLNKTGIRQINDVLVVSNRVTQGPKSDKTLNKQRKYNTTKSAALVFS